MKDLKCKFSRFKEAISIKGLKQLKKEDVVEYYKKRKARREEILAKRREGKIAKLIEPIAKMMEKFSIILHAIISIVVYFCMEIISRHSVSKAWEYLLESPWVFLYNSYMIFVSFSLVYLVRRRVFTRIILSVLWLILGICNGYMLLKRVTPFNAQDLKVAGDAVSLINAYFSGIELVLVVAGIIAAILWLVSMWRRGSQYKGKLYRGFAFLGCVAWLTSFIFVTDVALDKRIVSNYFGNMAFAYQDYGLPYCFMSSIFNTGISEPHVYSEEKVLEVTGNGEMASTVESKSEVNPNIILVQLESFFDPQEIEFFETDVDAIPNFRALTNEYSTGYFKVPSIGAGTANTEFEVLTGMSMRYFGPGEYPYKTILMEGTAESAATALADLGYGTHALHNNGGNFYSRAHVFNNIGFDSFTSEEFMNILQETPGGWATDDVLIENISNALDSTEGEDFVFTITVEGHGAYPEEKILENPPVNITGLDDEGIQNSWEYYLSLVKKMDDFVGTLIKTVEARGEPTVIAFYGDHLPTLNLEAEDLKSRYLYNTNYVIWDNIGLEKKDQTLAAYQITAEVLEQIGIKTGTVFNYHQERRKTVDYQADLELLQYDLLYGDRYAYQSLDKVDEEGHMQMGIKDVTLTNITTYEEGRADLYGENFTKWSDVYVNEERVKTKFINDTYISIPDIQLEENDIIEVLQVGSSETVFRTSATYQYIAGELIEIEPVDLGDSWLDGISDEEE